MIHENHIRVLGYILIALAAAGYFRIQIDRDRKRIRKRIAEKGGKTLAIKFTTFSWPNLRENTFWRGNAYLEPVL